MGKNKKVTPIKAQDETKERPLTLTVMVMQGYLLVQPNFDIPAGATIQVLPQSGTQVVGKQPTPKVEVKEEEKVGE